MSLHWYKPAESAGGVYTSVYVHSLVHRYNTSFICSRLEYRSGSRSQGQWCPSICYKLTNGHKCQEYSRSTRLAWCCISPSMKSSAFRWLHGSWWDDGPSVPKWKIHHSLEITVLAKPEGVSGTNIGMLKRRPVLSVYAGEDGQGSHAQKAEQLWKH